MSDTSYWIRFFVAAGVPPGLATTYAITFVDNRIQKDMLGDLNKEYLQEMGIETLGDIISILKQAKVVQKEAAKNKVLFNPSQGVKSPALRTVNHYLKMSTGSPTNSPKRAGSPATQPVDRPDVARPISARPALSARPASGFTLSQLTGGLERPAKIMLSTGGGGGGGSGMRMDEPVMRRKPVTVTFQRYEEEEEMSRAPVAAVRPKQVVSLKRLSPATPPALKEVVPVPKRRRVMPEEEGAYKIKMPDGSVRKAGGHYSVRAQALPPGPASAPTPTPRVFRRLGAGVDDVKSRPTAVTVSFNSQDESVFRRLGGKNLDRQNRKVLAASEPKAPAPKDSLGYAGILRISEEKKKKITLAKAKMKLMEVRKEMAQSDAACSTQGVLAPHAAVAQRRTIKARLGNKGGGEGPAAPVMPRAEAGPEARKPVSQRVTCVLPGKTDAPRKLDQRIIRTVQNNGSRGGAQRKQVAAPKSGGVFNRLGTRTVAR